MARARPVARQHIQVLVNGLLEDGHVELAENPAHKRSHLVRLTESGMKFVAVMKEREAKALAELAIDIDETELRQAALVLRRLRKAFESAKWRSIASKA